MIEMKRGAMMLATEKEKVKFTLIPYIIFLLSLTHLELVLACFNDKLETNLKSSILASSFTDVVYGI